MAKNENNNGGIVVQAGILAAASIIVRIIGLLYRAPLTAIIGDEGNGLYGTAYNIYTIILMVSSYSIPSALSKLMAQKLALGQYRGAQQMFRCAMTYALCVGGACSMLLWFGAGALVPQVAVPVLRVFAPTIFLFAILGVLRGYFQAQQTMVPTSVSQILEQIANAAVSIGAAYLLMTLAAGKGGNARAVMGASGSALGTGAGVTIALIFMAVVYFRSRPAMRRKIDADQAQTEPFGRAMLTTIAVITPFILSGFILNLTTTTNQTIYQRLMINVRGMKAIDATTLYGLFSNKAVVITNIPISIATAVASAIIPNISTSFAQGDLKETRRRATNALRLTLIVAVPCAVGLIVLAKPITMIMFPQWDTLSLASSLLATLSVTVIFYSVGTVTNAVLQAIGKMNMPLVSAGIALVIQTIFLYVLLMFTPAGIYSLVLASILYSAMIWAINEMFLHRYLHLRTQFVAIYGGPLISAAVMGVGAVLVYQILYRITMAVGIAQYFSNFIALIPAILLAILIYFFVLIRIGSFTEKDILSLPKGAKIARALRKLHFLAPEKKV